MITGKRVFDLFFALIGILVLAPLFAAIAALIRLEGGGPVFFSQARVGYKGRPFMIRKFRTMVRDAEKIGGQLTIGRDPRITRVGSRLRKTKLDELPQLINVVLGEMALVGPRPEVPRYVALYNNEQRKVLELLPGITDPASIIYSNWGDSLACTDDPESLYIKEIISEKIRLNLMYAKRATVFSDIRVIFSTILKVAAGICRCRQA